MPDLEISTDKLVKILEDPQSTEHEFNQAQLRIKTIQSLQK